jgi:branched-chain amino acid transport system substrate-binding protein
MTVLCVAFGLASATAALAQQGKLCGLNNGKAATGQPILVGSVVGKTGPDDFSAGARAAKAYFDCVNKNGGINGRPIQYLIEDDQWKPEVAGQVARLVKDRVCRTGRTVFAEMTVISNRIAGGVASSPGLRRANASSRRIPLTNQVRFRATFLRSSGGEKTGHQEGRPRWPQHTEQRVWSCNLTNEWLKEKGLSGVSVLIDPGAPDPNSAVLEAVATGADTFLMTLPSGLAQAFLKAAQDQNLRDKYKWISPTPLYKQGIPEALGAYWSGKVHVAIELTPWDGSGPDGKRGRA